MKPLKKLLSLCLALLIIFTLTVPALSADEKIQTCPLIFIHGFTASDVYADTDDKNTLISIPSVDEILSAAADTLLPALAVYCIDRDADKLAHKATVRINEMFAGWFNEKTGEAKKGSGIIPEALTDVTSESRLIFSYDWRGDPLAIADSLNSYIEKVCELSGSDKVALGCHSLGSTIALAYLTKYGNNRISGIVYDSPAVNGVALIGNVLTGKVNLDGEAIGSFLKASLGETEYKKLVSGLIDIFESAGLIDLIIPLTDDIIEALAPVIYRETVAPLVGGWLTIWSMLPDSQVDEAKSFIFGEILKGEDYSILQEKIDSYTRLVRENKEKTLRDFNNVGNLAIISRYDTKTIPLRGSSDLLSDMIIETSATSFGATTAPIGDFFSDEYLKGKDMKYISPDRTVDASTCLFPEQTWFIKDSGHFDTDGLTVNYYDMFLFSEEELTCDTAEIGRFLSVDAETYTLVEDTSSPEKTEKTTLIKSFYSFIIALYETLSALIVKAFA